VTSPPESTPVGQILRPLRDLAAYALVGATAVWLLVAIIDLIPDGSHQFGGRTEASFVEFVNLPTVAFPIAAVLLALLVQPRHPKARLIVLAALVEYAVAAFFGVFFGLLIGLINLASDAGARAAFMGLLTRIAWLAVLAVPAYAVFLIWQRLFTAPKPPRPGPGVYGQPPQFNPSAFPGQPGYGPPPPGHPGPPAPGHPGPPPAPGSFGPTMYGAPPSPTAPPFQGAPPQSAPPFQGAPPQSAPPFQGAPPQSAPPFQGAPPQSAPPFQGAPPQGAPPQSAPPFQGAPPPSASPFPAGSPPESGAGQPPSGAEPNPSWNQPPMPMQAHGRPTVPNPTSDAPFSEPTQVVPQHHGDDRTGNEDRTEKIDEPRAGFGPAEPDPPRS
jgi:hypothetical protein